IVFPIVAVVVRDRPQTIGLEPYGAAEPVPVPERSPHPLRPAVDGLLLGLKSETFWLLSCTFFICGLSTNGLIGQHLIPGLTAPPDRLHPQSRSHPPLPLWVVDVEERHAPRVQPLEEVVRDQLDARLVEPRLDPDEVDLRDRLHPEHRPARDETYPRPSL